MISSEAARLPLPQAEGRGGTSSSLLLLCLLPFHVSNRQIVSPDLQFEITYCSNVFSFHESDPQDFFSFALAVELFITCYLAHCILYLNQTFFTPYV